MGVYAIWGVILLVARRHFHPESPMTGEKWMQKDVEFTKLKLSNKLDANDYVS